MTAMDVNTHVRAIWRHRWALLTAAAAVGLLVLGLRLLATPTYTTAASLYLVPGAQDAATLARLTEVYALLDDNPLVLRSTSEELGDVDADSVRRATDIIVASDGLLQVTAVAGTGAESARTANAFAAALSRAADLDQRRAQALALKPLDAQLAEVDRQLAPLAEGDPGLTALQEQSSALVAARADLLARSLPRLDVLANAEARDAARSPQPVRDAALAFLVAFIVLAELTVLRVVRQGRLDGMGVAESLERLSGLPVLRVGRSGDGGDGSVALLALVLADAPADAPAVVTLLPLDPTPAAQACVVLLADAATRGGQPVVVVSAEDPPAPVSAASSARELRTLSPGAAELATQARAGRMAQTRAGQLVLVVADSWDAPQVLALGGLPGPTVLVVDGRAVRGRAVEEALKVLRLAGNPAELVVLTDLGRRRARAWLKAGGAGPAPAQGPATEAPAPARSAAGR